MASGIRKSQCVKCNKPNGVMKCGGCSQEFCYNHVIEHRQELNRQLDQIENNRDLFRQRLNGESSNIDNQHLFEEIDRWELESIEKIQRTAREAREILLNNSNKDLQTIEKRLDLLTNDLKQNRDENSFVESNLQEWNQQLNELTEQLDNMRNSIVEDNSSAFIKKISVVVYSPQIINTDLSSTARWVQHGVTVAGGNGYGDALSQLAHPWAICLDSEGTIYVADTGNYRVVAWTRNGRGIEIVAGGNGDGWRNDQLAFAVSLAIDKKSDCLFVLDKSYNRLVQWPRRNGTEGKPILNGISCQSLALDNNGDIYIAGEMSCDVKRYKRGETVGRIVAGGNGHGDNLNQIAFAHSIFVDDECSIYICDSMNSRVVKWTRGATEGIVVAGGNGKGEDRTQLSSPYGLTVDRKGNVYIADCGNHRIVRWTKGAREGDVIIGGNGMGSEANHLRNPCDLAFDSANNLYVLDSGNQRVQKFYIQK